jgi:PEP-CTERM motif
MNDLTKKLTLTLGCFALLASFTGVARADAISFNFVFSPTPVTVNATGLSAGPALVLLVSDTKIPAVFSLVGTATISTGPASSYVAAGNVLVAQFLPGAGIEVEVDSAQCTGTGVCLQGILNSNGEYSATLLGTGSLQALFTVTYVNPYIPALFGDPSGWQPTGSDSLTTSVNQFKNGGNTDSATLGGGSITYQTPVPEPSSLALVGSGVLGLASLIRRKMK